MSFATFYAPTVVEVCNRIILDINKKRVEFKQKLINEHLNDKLFIKESSLWQILRGKGYYPTPLTDHLAWEAVKKDSRMDTVLARIRAEEYGEANFEVAWKLKKLATNVPSGEPYVNIDANDFRYIDPWWNIKS